MYVHFLPALTPAAFMLLTLAPVNQPATIVVTSPPQATITISPTSSSPPPISSSTSKPRTPLTAILLPTILLPILAILALLFFLHRRRQRQAAQRPKIYEAPDSTADRPPPPTKDLNYAYAMRRELVGDEGRRMEVPAAGGGGGRRVIGVQELESRNMAVELDAGGVGEKRGEKEGWV